jgi:hypothetical protein
MERWFRSRFSWQLWGRFHRGWRSGGEFSGEAKRLDLSSTLLEASCQENLILENLDLKLPT